MDELSARRKGKRIEAAPRRMSELLRMVEQALRNPEKYEWKTGAPRAVMVVTIGDGGVHATWAGAMENADFHEAKLAVDDSYYRCRTDGFKDPDRAQRRKEWRAEQERKQAEHEAANPHKCNSKHCTFRTNTERGLRIHERSCRWIKYDRDAQTTQDGGTG